MILEPVWRSSKLINCSIPWSLLKKDVATEELELNEETLPHSLILEIEEVLSKARIALEKAKSSRKSSPPPGQQRQQRKVVDTAPKLSRVSRPTVPSEKPALSKHNSSLRPNSAILRSRSSQIQAYATVFSSKFTTLQKTRLAFTSTKSEVLVISSWRSFSLLCLTE